MGTYVWGYTHASAWNTTKHTKTSDSAGNSMEFCPLMCWWFEILQEFLGQKNLISSDRRGLGEVTQSDPQQEALTDSHTFTKKCSNSKMWLWLSTFTAPTLVVTPVTFWGAIEIAQEALKFDLFQWPKMKAVLIQSNILYFKCYILTVLCITGFD